MIDVYFPFRESYFLHGDNLFLMVLTRDMSLTHQYGDHPLIKVD